MNDRRRDDTDRAGGPPHITSRWKGVRQLIEEGILPGVIPSRLWGGRGRGERCAACGSHIAADECVFEVPAAGDMVTLDRGCLNLWMASISRGP